MHNFAEKRPSEIPIVVLDTETTGLMPQMGHRVVEIGAVRFENGQEVSKINTLLNPNRKMEANASRVNGITDGALIGKPTFVDIMPELLLLLDGALLVAHNARFDAGFLGMEFYIQGIQTQKSPFKLENPWLCTLELARAYFRFGRNNLGHIAQALGIRTTQAHRALNDVYTTAEIFKKMIQELSRKRITTIDDLLYAQGHPIYAPDHANLMLPNEAIRIALQDKQQLLINYKSRNGSSYRKITPRYPTLYKGSYYLVAYCHSQNDQRTFKVDRIIEAKILAGDRS